MQTKVPIIIALVFGAFAFFGINRYLNSQKVNKSTTNVLVLKTDRKKGDALRNDDITTLEIDSDAAAKIHGMALPKDKGLYVGQKIVADMMQNDILMEQSMERSVPVNETFRFDSKLQEGERAIAIEVDNAGSLGSFLLVGDRVDILANLEVPDKTVRTITVPNQGPQTIEEISFRPTTVFLFENVKVLAIGDEYMESPGLDLSHTRNLSSSTAVTIAVTPREAQILSFAMRNGRKDSSGGQSDVTFTLLLRKQTDPGTISPRTEASYNDVLNMTDLEKLQNQRNDRMK